MIEIDLFEALNEAEKFGLYFSLGLGLCMILVMVIFTILGGSNDDK